MKALTLVIGLAVAGAATAAHAECAKPAAVSTYLAANPGWAVVEEATLTPVDRSLWAKDHAGACPGIAGADFAGSGATVYAVALTRTRGAEQLQQLVLVDGAGSTVLRAAKPTTTPSVVWTAPAGVLEEFKTDRRVTTAHPAFVYQALEGSAQAFYRADGQVRSVWISD